MPRIKMPTNREMLLKRKYPKAFREDSIVGNSSTSYEEQKKIDDEASLYWQELQEKSDDEIEAIFEEEKKRRDAEFEAKNPIPPREEVYEKLKLSHVICPEGVNALAAMMLFGYKKLGAKWKNRKVGEVMPDFLEFLILTPKLEVFTIDSYDGQKSPLDRDYLRSTRARKDFIKCHIPRNGSTYGEYIFVNKEQFENYLDDKPIQPINVGLEERPTKQSANLKSDKPLGTRERCTLHKIILGMAVKGYAYKPEASKSSVPREISDDLALLGLEVTAETVRNYLQQAYSEFPVSTEKHD